MAKQECSEEELKSFMQTLDLKVAEEQRRSHWFTVETIRPLEAQLKVSYRTKNEIDRVIDGILATKEATAKRIEQIHYERCLVMARGFISEEMPRHAGILQSSEVPQVKALGEVLNTVLQDPTFRKHLPQIVEPDLESYHRCDLAGRIALQAQGARLRLVICTNGTYGVGIREENGVRNLISLNTNEAQPDFQTKGVLESTMQTVGMLLSKGDILLPKLPGTPTRYLIKRSPSPSQDV